MNVFKKMNCHVRLDLEQDLLPAGAYESEVTAPAMEDASMIVFRLLAEQTSASKASTIAEVSVSDRMLKYSQLTMLHFNVRLTVESFPVDQIRIQEFSTRNKS
jgi:hypothetical protein